MADIKKVKVSELDELHDPKGKDYWIFGYNTENGKPKSKKVSLDKLTKVIDDAVKTEIANGTINFKAYHSSLNALQEAYPVGSTKKDFFAWVGPYPCKIYKVFADKAAWTDTGDIVELAGVDMGELVRKENKYYQKNWILHGHSMVTASEFRNGYSKILKAKLGLNYTNLGKSGCTMATSVNGSILPIIMGADYTNTNLVTIDIGSNDFRLDVKLGSFGSILDKAEALDEATFYGAFRKGIEHIISKNPNTEIVLLTPVHRNNSGYHMETENAAGFFLLDYSEAIKELGEKYAIKVIDMYSRLGVNMKNLNTFTDDGLHLLEVGYKLYADVMINELVPNIK